MKKLFYATKNKYKIQNMKDRLKRFDIELVTPYDTDIEIDINEEHDLLLFDNNLLSPSEKVRFINFKTPEKTIANDNGCKKLFKLLYLAKNGGVNFKDNLNISELNKRLFFNQDCWIRHNIVAEQPCDDYTDYDMCIDFHHGAGDFTDYMRFIANCAN